MTNMGPKRPYMLRAYYDWLMDNDQTPHLVVDALIPGTQVPQQFVKDGQIVLNIAPSAVVGLQLGNNFVEFSARFGGVPQQVVLPLAAIIAIYARENGEGVVFEMEDAYANAHEVVATDVTTSDAEHLEDTQTKIDEKTDSSSKKRSHLTLVK